MCGSSGLCWTAYLNFILFLVRLVIDDIFTKQILFQLKLVGIFLDDFLCI